MVTSALERVKKPTGRKATMTPSIPQSTLRLSLFLCLFCAFRASGQPAVPLVASGGAARLHEVIAVQDPQASVAFRPRPDRVRAMVDRAITNFTGKATVSQAWLSCIGSTQEIVGLKVFSAPGPNSGTRPAVVAAVIEGLLAAGLPAKHIVVWDREAADLKLAGFTEFSRRYEVRIASSAESGFDSEIFYETNFIGNLVWGDLEFGKKGEAVGRKSFFSKLLTHDITKIINVTPLLNHNLAGVSGNLYSLAMGSIDNSMRFESDAGRLANAVPEIYNFPLLNDRVALNIVDALICQYEGGERGLLHYSATLNELRFSRDPVALDVLSLQELDRQRQAADAPSVKTSLELYDNASVLELGISDVKKVQVQVLR